MGHPKPNRILRSSKLVALGLLESIAALTYLCVKYTRRASQKLVRASFKPSQNRFLAFNKKRTGEEREFGEESFGDGGLWQRTILMGDKCQPLDFSGVIYYDHDGKRIPELPVKSPRASPFVGYGYPTAEN